MKTYHLAAFLAFVFAFQASAQTADLASAAQNEPKTAANDDKQIKQTTDDNSVFSFLNFSFIKKPLSFFGNSTNEKNDVLTQTQTDDTSAPKETPIERATRMAEEGDVDAALSLGYMYLYGQDGVESDYQKSFHFYELAAAQNNVIALNNLGSLYFNGIGTTRDYKKAAELFLKAAQNGSDDAAVNLGFIYLSTGKKEYFQPAVDLFEQAAKSGNNTAKFMLGYAYHKGFVVDKDDYKTLELIKEASIANFDEAHYVLAQIYTDGRGTAQNYTKAIKYYRAAVGQGHIESMLTLADIYAEGRMTTRSLGQAYILYNIASVYGAPNADKKRDALGSALKLEELLEAQNAASQYKESPSELTTYIRQTFGTNIRRYIDDHLEKQGNKN
ncbi:MAG: sel1 repeat family protein [Alphaproteobacteria bacterium]|nr:sel1 repeat family protein [Alphaproteobacteria bacterium]